MQPYISVIIPVKEDPRVFDAIRSIQASDYPAKRYSIVIIDNGSSAGYFSQLTDSFTKSSNIFILQEPTPGSYNARNTGITFVQANETFKADIIAFTDSDCTVDPTWLTQIAASVSLPGVDAVMGMAKGLNTNVIAQHEQHMYEQIIHAFADSANLERIDTRNVAISTSAIKATGNFLPIKFGGDMEYGARLHSAGFVIRFNQAMLVTHNNPTDFTKLLAKRVEQNYGNMEIMQHHDEAFIHRYLPHLQRYSSTWFRLLQWYELRLVQALEFPIAHVACLTISHIPGPWGFFYYKLLTIRAIQLGQLTFVLGKTLPRKY